VQQPACCQCSSPESHEQNDGEEPADQRNCGQSHRDDGDDATAHADDDAHKQGSKERGSELLEALEDVTNGHWLPTHTAPYHHEDAHG